MTAELSPREGDIAFVWWNTGRRAPRWAGEWYLARVVNVQPYKGPESNGVGWIVDLTPGHVFEPTPMMVMRGDRRLFWNTHPCNPRPGSQP
jgi:hypothetical protein